MKFKVGDKVRTKSQKQMIKLGYDTHKSWYKLEDVVWLVGDSVDLYENGNYKVDQLQLILESPKLTLRLSQSGLKLKVKILEQDNDLRYIGEIVRHNKYSIISDNEPEIFIGKTLFIKGKNYGYDKNKISYEFNSQEELDEFVEALRVMMMSEVLK